MKESEGKLEKNDEKAKKLKKLKFPKGYFQTAVQAGLRPTPNRFDRYKRKYRRIHKLKKILC